MDRVSQRGQFVDEDRLGHGPWDAAMGHGGHGER